MTTKNLVVLGGVAVALAVAAAFMGKGSSSSPRLTGERIVPKFDMSLVSSVEIGDKVKLADSPDGWIVPSMQDYPADLVKIRENLLKLQELKVGQVVRGRELKEKTPVILRDSSGKELASVVLGDRHEKWGHGRYVQYKDQSVLVSDTLDDFGTDSKRWVETKIVDEPYVSFRELADPKLTEDELGFATGVVAKVTIAGDTNRVATVGNVVKGGSERYLKLDNEKWVFIVPSYSVEKLLPKPEPGEEPKSEEKTEPKAESEAEPKAEEPAAEPAKAEEPASDKPE